jgi:very-short-patch-repair endonuclease
VREKHPRDLELAALATRQHGVVARRQLIELGLGTAAIRHRLANGRLHPLHTGVYAVGHAAIGSAGRWMGAVLAYGPDAVLSHRSAGAHWQLRPTARADVDVTAPGRTRHSRRGITVHRVRKLHPEDRTCHNAIPITTVARTLLDLAEVIRPRELDRAFEEAERLRHLDIRAIERLWNRSRGRHGLPQLGTLIAEHHEPAPATRSELEGRFLELCRDAQLPAPSVNARVAGLEVDALWRDRRLVVELDGHAFHHTRASFERDRTRDAKLQLAGYRVLRITHRRLVNEPARVTAIVRTLLDAN